MTQPHSYALLLTTLILCPGPATAAESELKWNIESATRQLQRQGSDFGSLYGKVDIEWNTPQEGSKLASGRIFINDDGEIRIDSDASTMLAADGTVYYYEPDLQRVQEYRLSQHPNRLEPLLAIGFSTTGNALDDDYLVTYLGEDETGDRRLLGLELTPKREKDREWLSKIELWVDQASWMPARQVMVQAAGGATMTASYSQMALNLDLNPDLFRDRWPKGTQTVRQ